MMPKALHLTENFLKRGGEQNDAWFYNKEGISAILVHFLQVFDVTYTTRVAAYPSHLTCLSPESPSFNNITSLFSASQPSAGHHHRCSLPVICLPSPSLAPASTLTPNIAGMAVFLKQSLLHCLGWLPRSLGYSANYLPWLSGPFTSCLPFPSPPKPWSPPRLKSPLTPHAVVNQPYPSLGCLHNCLSAFRLQWYPKSFGKLWYSPLPICVQGQRLLELLQILPWRF